MQLFLPRSARNMAANLSQLMPGIVPVGRFSTVQEIANVVLMLVRKG